MSLSSAWRIFYAYNRVFFNGRLMASAVMNKLTFTEAASLMEYGTDIGMVKWILKPMLGVLIVASVVLGLGCAGGTEVQVGQLVTGTITDSDDDDGNGNLRPLR